MTTKTNDRASTILSARLKGWVLMIGRREDYQSITALLWLIFLIHELTDNEEEVLS